MNFIDSHFRWEEIHEDNVSTLYRNTTMLINVELAKPFGRFLRNREIDVVVISNFNNSENTMNVEFFKYSDHDNRFREHVATFQVDSDNQNYVITEI